VNQIDRVDTKQKERLNQPSSSARPPSLPPQPHLTRHTTAVTPHKHTQKQKQKQKKFFFSIFFRFFVCVAKTENHKGEGIFVGGGM
jgi:hypothetical protein